MKEALFWKKKNSEVQCQLCPRNCSIAKDNWGFCRARKNVNGKLISMVYGRAIGPNIDPIEKKPLYHFLPGSASFSFGTAGCNLRCPYCQNWQDAQAYPDQVYSVDLPPEKAVELAHANDCKSIAYTYTEPFIFFEYMADTAKLAHKVGIKNVAVTNGFVSQEPLKRACKFLDGANVDLKGFDDVFYRKQTTAWLQPVLDTLKILKENGVWLEITNLLIPGLNDDFDKIKKMAMWIKGNLGDEIPLHFTAFYPAYKMTDRAPTPPKLVRKARELALKLGLKFVYTGNIADEEGSTTFCPSCGEPIIRRAGFMIVENKLKDGKCPCGQKIPGVWK